MVSSKIKYIESRVAQLIAEGHSVLTCRAIMMEEIKMKASDLDFAINDIMKSIRRTVISGPRQVFWQHVQRYDLEILNHYQVGPIVAQIDDEEEDVDHDQIREREQKILMSRIRILSNLLRFLKQKEDLLGFHKSNLKVIIRDSISKKLELDRQLSTRAIEQKAEELNLNKLDQDQKVRLLFLLNKCYALTEEPGKIVRPIEAEAVAKLESIERGRTEDISLTELAVPEEQIKNYYGVAEALRASQLEAAKKAFERK